MNAETVGLLGGTGEEGRGIALRLARAGQRVRIGSRSLDKAQEAAAWINSRIEHPLAVAGTNLEAVAECEILFLTVPFRFAAAMIEEARDSFREGQIVVDVTVPLSFQKGPRLVTPEEGSGGEHLRALLPPEVGLAAAFKTLPAHLLVEGDEPLECDEFLCADSPENARRVLDVVSAIRDLRWIDAGPLRSCRSLEGMTLLAITLNRRYKSRLGRYRILGI